MYEYRCSTVRVIDGDTILLDIDLGCHVHIVRPVRLLGINAPEKRLETKQAGLEAMEYLAGLVKDQKLVIKTKLDSNDKYGRLLGKVFFTDGRIDSVADMMVMSGHAVRMEK